MKLIFALVATLIAFSAQANDYKVGNVIAVERQITNLYENCINNLTSDAKKKQSLYFCSINYLKSPFDLPVTKGGVIRFAENGCRVDAEVGNGVLVITFGKTIPKGATADYAAAKTCLQSAMRSSNSVSLLVYTLE